MTVEAKNLMWKDKSGIKAGPFEVSLGKSLFEEKPVVQITHSQPNIKSVQFFDNKGKVISSASAGRQSWSTNDGPPTYRSDYRVKGIVEGGAIQIRYYSKIEVITKPIDLKVGVGF